MNETERGYRQSSLIDKAASIIEPVLHTQLGELALRNLKPISPESVAQEKKQKRRNA